MATYALTGDDQIIINQVPLNDFPDGDIGTLSIQNTVAEMTTGKNANTIFALNENGAIKQYGKVQLYSLKLFDGERKIRDFVPCYQKSDGVIGMYDLVHDVFYTNKGTGNFLKGQDI